MQLFCSNYLQTRTTQIRHCLALNFTRNFDLKTVRFYFCFLNYLNHKEENRCESKRLKFCFGAASDRFRSLSISRCHFKEFFKQKQKVKCSKIKNKKKNMRRIVQITLYIFMCAYKCYSFFSVRQKRERERKKLKFKYS